MRLPWAQLSVRLGRCGRVRCEPGWRLGPGWGARLGDCDLWLVWAGRGRMRLRDGDIELERGVCLWMRPGGRYEAEQDPDDRLGVTFQHFDVLDAAGEPIHDPARLPPEHHRLTDAAYADAVLARTVALTVGAPVPWGRPPTDGPEIARALLRGLLMDVDARSATGPPAPAPAGTERHHRQRVAEAAARLNEAPERAPSVAALAAEAGYSADHFARVFRAVTGMTPRAYRVQARIRRAQELLTESSLTVSQIADALGYRDAGYFCRQFKQATGKSPGRMRAEGGCG